ncbi:MAG TPA: HigA family addiction module antitoxin [Candidatus Egerieousia sp.]|nr:HigA family addiction module antitoxin [Candidatus Egerieousia sp.]
MSEKIFGYKATHPGEVLKDEIEYRKISQVELAKKMGMSYKILNDIINERRSLSTISALMFEAALDVSAESLMNLQLKYNIQTARQDKSLLKKLDRIRKFAAVL